MHNLRFKCTYVILNICTEMSDDGSLNLNK